MIAPGSSVGSCWAMPPGLKPPACNPQVVAYREVDKQGDWRIQKVRPTGLASQTG